MTDHIFTRLSDKEFSTIDPQTEGEWKIIAPFPISEIAALWAITDCIKSGNVRPAKGASITINFSIRLAKEGEIASQF